jgi:hypothetical protein
MEIKYSEKAVRQFKRIAKGDKKNAAMIMRTIEKTVIVPKTNMMSRSLKENTEVLKDFGLVIIV